MHDVYRHEALPYGGHDEFISSCVALAEDGRASGERLMFLAMSDKLADVQDAIGADFDDIAFVPTDEHGRNPARLMSLLDNFQATNDGRPCVGVNESVFAGRPAEAMAEAQLAETVLNSPELRSWPMSIVCLYDADELDDRSLAQMRRSHPVIRGEADNDAYEPDLAGAMFATALTDPPGAVDSRRVGPDELAKTRDFVRDYAEKADLAPDRLEDLVLAANEIVTNSLQHGGGQCRISLWSVDSSVVCEVRDRGLILDPLVGRLTPLAAAPAGRGLWLANHLCDLVQIRSSQAGTVVRLRVDR